MNRRDGFIRTMVLTLTCVCLLPCAFAAPPEQQIVVRHDVDDDDDDHKVVRKTRVVQYVPTRREYAHVRRTRYPHVHEGHIDHRTVVVRSARVQPYVIERFEPRTRDNLSLVIRHFKEGRPAEALPVWTSFVETLPTYREPVDLDEVMLYIARESCQRDNNASLFHAMKVDYLDDSVERLDQYVQQLRQQLDACNNAPGRCAPDTIRDLDLELVRTQSDWRNVTAELDRARSEFEAHSRDSGDYERCVASVYNDVYRTVETRVQISP